MIKDVPRGTLIDNFINNNKKRAKYRPFCCMQFIFLEFQFYPYAYNISMLQEF